MSALDRQLERLLKSAAQVPLRPIGEIPFAIEARTLAAWRQSGATAEATHFLTVLRRGLAFAGAVAMIAVAFSLQQDSPTPPDETAIVDDVFLVALSR